jgi:hypothetical protein
MKKIVIWILVSILVISLTLTGIFVIFMSKSIFHSINPPGNKTQSTNFNNIGFENKNVSVKNVNKYLEQNPSGQQLELKKQLDEAKYQLSRDETNIRMWQNKTPEDFELAQGVVWKDVISGTMWQYQQDKIRDENKVIEIQKQMDNLPKEPQPVVTQIDELNKNPIVHFQESQYPRKEIDFVGYSKGYKNLKENFDIKTDIVDNNLKIDVSGYLVKPYYIESRSLIELSSIPDQYSITPSSVNITGLDCITKTIQGKNIIQILLKGSSLPVGQTNDFSKPFNVSCNLNNLPKGKHYIEYYDKNAESKKIFTWQKEIEFDKLIKEWNAKGELEIRDKTFNKKTHYGQKPDVKDFESTYPDLPDDYWESVVEIT